MHACKADWGCHRHGPDLWIRSRTKFGGREGQPAARVDLTAIQGDPRRAAAIQSPNRYFAAPTPGSKPVRAGPGGPALPRRLRRGDPEPSTPIHTAPGPKRAVRGPHHPPTPLPTRSGPVQARPSSPARRSRAIHTDPPRSRAVQVARKGGCGATTAWAAEPGHHHALSSTSPRPLPPLPRPALPPLASPAPQPPVVCSPGPALEPPGPGQDTITRQGRLGPRAAGRPGGNVGGAWASSRCGRCT